MGSDRKQSLHRSLLQRACVALAYAAPRRFVLERADGPAGCGPACLVMMLRLHGLRVNRAEVFESVGDDRHGATATQLLECARRFGLNGQGVAVARDAIVELRTPCIVYYATHHFVVALRVRRDTVTILDPAGGVSALPFDVFASRFGGVALEFERSRDLRSLSKPAARASAMQVMRRTGALIAPGALFAAVLAIAVPIVSLGVSLLLRAATRNGFTASPARSIAAYALALVALMLVVLIRQRAMRGVSERFARVFATEVGELLSSRLFVVYRAPTSERLLKCAQSFEQVAEIVRTFAIPAFFHCLGALCGFAVLLVSLPGVLPYLVLAVVAGPTITAVSLSISFRAFELEQSRLGRTYARVAGLLRKNDLAARGGFREQLRAAIEGPMGREQSDTVRRGPYWDALARAEVIRVASLATACLLFEAWSGGSAAAPIIAALWITPLSWSFFAPATFLALHSRRVGELIQLTSALDRDLVALGDAARVTEHGAAFYRLDVSSLVVTRSEGRDSDAGITFGGCRGELVVITGASGSGKSRLLAAVAGKQRASAGAMRVNGTPFDLASASGLPYTCNVVSQNERLAVGSIRSNLWLENGPVADEVLREALASVGLINTVRRLPLGLDTPLGQRGSALSGGELQRLALARALVSDADVFILDEPVSELDEESADGVLRALMAPSRLVLVASCRLVAASAATRVVVLRDGESVASGHLDELGGAERVRALMRGE